MLLFEVNLQGFVNKEERKILFYLEGMKEVENGRYYKEIRDLYRASGVATITKNMRV